MATRKARRRPTTTPSARAKRPATRGKRAPAAAGTAGLSPQEVAAAPAAALDPLVRAITTDGGAVLARYRDPLYGHPLVLAALPLDKVARTAFQRDVSEAHVDRLVGAMERTGAYLDPVICIRDDDGHYRSPNGGHRLAALMRLGARSVTALVAPDPSLAFKILALNTEKAHALKERSLEAVRMLRALADLGGVLLDDARRGAPESAFAGELEEPQLLTLGAAYEERARLAGSAYHPLLKRIDAWLELSPTDALAERQRRARLLLALDDVVSPLVEALREQGITSPALRSVLLARVAPLPPRGVKLPGSFDDVLLRATEKARAFDPRQISWEHISRVVGAPAEAEE